MVINDCSVSANVPIYSSYNITFNWYLCGEPAISHDSHHVSLVQWTNLFASRHKGHRFKSPGGYLCETGILLLALSRYTFTFEAR